MEPEPTTSTTIAGIDIRRQLTALGFALFVTYMGIIFLRNIPQQGIWWTDWLAFYTAGQMILEGETDHLYDLNTQLDYQLRIVGDKNEKENPFGDGKLLGTTVLGYYNAPPLAVLVVPFSLLPLEVSWWTWLCCNVCFLIAILSLCRVHLGRSWSKGEQWAGLAAILSYFPLVPSLNAGQLTLFVCLLIGCTIFSWRSNRPWLAGLFLSLLIIKPQMATFLALAVVIDREWKILLSTLSWGLGLFAGTSLLLGYRVWLDWLKVLSEVGSVHGVGSGVDTWRMPNLRGFFVMTFPSDYQSWVSAFTYFCFFIGATMVVWIWWHQDRKASVTEHQVTSVPPSPLFDTQISCTLFLLLAVNPHLFNYGTFMAIFPALLLYHSLRENRTWVVAYGWFLVLSLFTFFLASFTVIEELPPFALGPRLITCILFGHVVFSLAWLKTQRRRLHTTMTVE
ncbi:Hypothetical protein PBC10988_30740 [Planctomycetales bacterium 10988]|nr:Hypothetical protein PBC10988_30740 [Planctomycetales bacterium 10988]